MTTARGDDSAGAPAWADLDVLTVQTVLAWPMRG